MEPVNAIRSHAITTRTVDKHRWLRDRHLAAATPTWKQSSATEHSMVARDDGTVQNRLRSQLRAVAALDTSRQSARATYDPDGLIRHSDESVMAAAGAVDSRYERPLVSTAPQMERE